MPDEVELTISIREYFEEEYIPGKRIEDYKTKVPLRNIESEFYKHLESIGYSKKDLTLLGAGDFWRNAGLPVQFSKQFSICVPGLEQIEKLVQALDMRGVESVSIRQLKNKKLTALRKQVKIQALEMAKEKAAYLLESQGHKAGSLVSIREVNNDNGFSYSYSTSNMLSNSVSFSDNKSGLQSISIRYEIEVSYLID
ncbi:MAG: SIMPL domain-containing protein [Bacteroidetes bacterium]|nr:SIMPL domain-containing protein [Bacteroidota bacterium]